MPTPQLITKLPAVGTTVFSTMSALAVEYGAVNLSQGFPNYACVPALIDMVSDAMRAGHYQYPMMTGVPALREGVPTPASRCCQPTEPIFNASDTMRSHLYWSRNAHNG